MTTMMMTRTMADLQRHLPPVTTTSPMNLRDHRAAALSRPLPPTHRLLSTNGRVSRKGRALRLRLLTHRAFSFPTNSGPPRLFSPLSLKAIASKFLACAPV